MRRLIRKPVKSQDYGHGYTMSNSIKEPTSTNEEANLGQWNQSLENVDAADDQRFLEQMSSHTLSEAVPAASRNTFESNSGTGRTGVNDTAQKRNINKNHDGQSNDNTSARNMFYEQEVPDMQNLNSETRNVDGGPFEDDEEEEDSDADSFDQEMEEKVFTLRQAQAIKHIEDCEWLEAESLISKLLIDPCAGRCPKYENYDIEDWRIFLSFAQVLQGKLAAGILTSKTIDTAKAAVGQLGLLYLAISLWYCYCKTNTDKPNLKMAERYCLRAIKCFRKANYDGQTAVAAETMSVILKENGDLISSKAYASLLPPGWKAPDISFSDLQKRALVSQCLMSKTHYTTTLTVSQQPVNTNKLDDEKGMLQPQPTLDKSKELNKASLSASEVPIENYTPPASKLRVYKLEYRGDGSLLGASTSCVAALKSAVDNDDAQFVAYLVKNLIFCRLTNQYGWNDPIPDGIEAALRENGSHRASNFILYAAKYHKSMAIPNLILQGEARGAADCMRLALDYYTHRKNRT